MVVVEVNWQLGLQEYLFLSLVLVFLCLFLYIIYAVSVLSGLVVSTMNETIPTSVARIMNDLRWLILYS